MCIVINDFIGFTQYLLLIQSSESGLFETGYYTTNVSNELQVIIVFLTDVPKPTHKRKCQNTLDTRLIKHGHNCIINVKKVKFLETVKKLLSCIICDTAVAVPFQPVVNCCTEVFIFVNYLYRVTVDERNRLGWRVFPKIDAHIFGFCCVQAQIRSITPCNKVV